MTDQDLRPPQQRARAERGAGNSSTRWLLTLLVLAALGYGGWSAWQYWQARQAPSLPAPSAAPAMPEPAASAEPVVPPPVDAAVQAPTSIPVPAAGPKHPLATADVPAQVADAAAPSLDQLALQWLGPQSLKFLVTPGLAHHVVATVDNLPRSHAAPRLWPLSPVGGKIMLEEGSRDLQIAPGNHARYDGVVNFVTGIDPAQAAAWYRQAYPLLQQSYEDLGYPGQYFNDRLVEVIDHLLLTPEPIGPLAVDLVQVQGQIAPQQPWLRYEFADKGLEQLSAGQKILLRLGPEHRQRLKAYLQALRAQVAQP